MSQANSNIPYTLTPTDPSLRDLLDLVRKEVMLTLNSHHIGTVESFDATKQTVTATINYPKTYFVLNEQSGAFEPKSVDYPILTDCPAIVLGGGNSALTFPIQEGDECLILFNDRDLENWFAGGVNSPLASARLHSFSDGIALVGLNSLNNLIQNYDTMRAVLRNGNALVGVGPSLVKIANNTTTLKTLLQSLITDLQTLCTNIEAITVICAAPASPSSVPVNAAAFVAVSASLTTLTGQIAGLLE